MDGKDLFEKDSMRIGRANAHGISRFVLEIQAVDCPKTGSVDIESCIIRSADSGN